MKESGAAISAARRLISGLIESGLGGAVVSPGSRNAPLMQAIRDAGLPEIVALDERAAAHHALGMALALNQPVAVCCTSGTAAINHGPALAEASQLGLPIISLTADRPEGAANQWESQTLVQSGMHARHVRGSYLWPPKVNSEADCLDAIRADLLYGPVHVNCPFDEPLYPSKNSDTKGEAPFSGQSYPQFETRNDLQTSNDALLRIQQALERQERIMLLGGTQQTVIDTDTLSTWGQKAVIVGDSTSGLGASTHAIIAVDRWMRRWKKSGKAWSEVKPDLVVGFGAPLLSKALRNALRTEAVDHIHIDPTQRFPCAFQQPPIGVQMPVQMALAELSKHMESHAPTDAVRSWQLGWHDIESRTRAAHHVALDASPWSDLVAHAILHEAIPLDWDLHLGNSTPVRYAQLFHRSDRPAPWSNRGVAGIDGCSSTAVGAALARRNTTLITGDLGFLYDANAFLVHPIPSQLRIAVIHNGGGGVFRWLDGPERTGLLESHFEMRHGRELSSLCDFHSLEHQRVTNGETLRAALSDWWSPSAVPRVLEIVTSPELSAEAYSMYMDKVSV